MKRTAIIAVFISGILISAQAQENYRWIGGTLSISAQDTDFQKETRLVLMPEFGYNTGGAWDVGVRAGIMTEKTVQGDNTSRSNQFSVVPFARYKIGEIAGFQIFGQAELPLNFFGGKNFDGSSSENSNSVGFNVLPGLSYDLGGSWGFNMYMPPVLRFLNRSTGTTTYSFGLNDGYTVQSYLLSTSIGFTYSF